VKTYDVQIRAIIHRDYVVTVAAPDAEIAEQKAEEMLLKGQLDIYGDHIVDVEYHGAEESYEE
jgi:hypothetical protein